MAQILKNPVSEFADCTLKDIEQKYIEGDPTLTINTVPLDDSIYIKVMPRALFQLKKKQNSKMTTTTN